MTRAKKKAPRDGGIESYLDARITAAVRAAYSPAVSIWSSSLSNGEPFWLVMLGDECVAFAYYEECAIDEAQRIDAGLEQGEPLHAGLYGAIPARRAPVSHSLVTVYCRSGYFALEPDLHGYPVWDVMIGDLLHDSTISEASAIAAALELDAAIEQALAELEPPQTIVKFSDRFEPVGRR